MKIEKWFPQRGCAALRLGLWGVSVGGLENIELVVTFGQSQANCYAKLG